MSLVYHGYKVDKEDFWDAVEQIRDIYYREHPATEEVRDIIEAFIEDPDKFDRDSTNVLEEISETKDFYADRAAGHREGYKRENLVQLQVYDLGDFFTFRAVEPGYFFGNVIAEHLGGRDEDAEGTLDPFWYDGRVLEGNAKAGAERVAELQGKGRYFLVPVLTVDDMTDVYFDEKREELAEAGRRHREEE